MGRNKTRQKKNFVQIPDVRPDMVPIRAKLKHMADTAAELYAACQTAGIADILCPAEWILNQDEMHQFWDKLKPMIRDPKYNQANMAVLADYMNFMCGSYPPGFGEKILACYTNNKGCDGAELYQHLSYNAL